MKIKDKNKKYNVKLEGFSKNRPIINNGSLFVNGALQSSDEYMFKQKNNGKAYIVWDRRKGGFKLDNRDNITYIKF